METEFPGAGGISMTKEKYIEVLTLAGATLLSGKLKTAIDGSIAECAARNASEIFAEAVKIANREFPEKEVIDDSGL